MIIKSHGIRTGTAGRVLRYVLDLGANEAVELLGGDFEALKDADMFAAVSGHKNGILHFTISPDQELSSSELDWVMTAINDEFGFDPSDPIVLVRHSSTRKNGVLLSHFHLARPAADRAGKVYDVYRSKKKDETVSRFTEIELGHRLITGKHSDFVHDRFLERGLDIHAKKVEPFLNAKVQARIAPKQHQKFKRIGFDNSNFITTLKEIRSRPLEEQPKHLASLLTAHGGLKLEHGSRKSRVLVKQGENVLFNANRYLELPGPLVADFIEKTKWELDNGSKKPAEEAKVSKCDIKTDGKYRLRSEENVRNDSGVIASRDIEGRMQSARSARDPNPESASYHRGQLHHQNKYECTHRSFRGTEVGLRHRSFSSAMKAVEPMISDLKMMAKNYCASSVEPSPDFDDPFLMMKLSRMLSNSLKFDL